MSFSRDFSKWIIKGGYLKVIKEKYPDGLTLSPTGIEPLDDIVIEHIPKMEKYYRSKYNAELKLSPLDILGVREEFCKKFKDNASMGWYPYPYFAVFEIPVSNTSVRTPEGAEFEDFLIGIGDSQPFRIALNTQNIILLRLLELKLKDLEMENYISEMLGEKIQGVEVKEFIKTQFPLVFSGEKLKPLPPLEKKKTDYQKIFRKIFGVEIAFFRPGPYESNFQDRIAAPYFRELKGGYFTQAVDYFRGAIGVP